MCRVLTDDVIMFYTKALGVAAIGMFVFNTWSATCSSLYCISPPNRYLTCIRFVMSQFRMVGLEPYAMTDKDNPTNECIV